MFRVGGGLQAVRDGDRLVANVSSNPGLGRSGVGGPVGRWNVGETVLTNE